MLPNLLALNFGPPEILLGVLLIVLLFGAAKIPELARSMGKAKSEYQKAVREGEREVAAAGESDEETLKAARALGIPTEGRPIADVRADVRRRLNA